MLPRLGAEGVKSIVVVPISFVSEHIETLEEIDIEYRELAEGAGIVNWRRVPALNTDDDFITDLADLVSDALNEPRLTVTAACVRNNCVDEGEATVEEMMGVNGMKGEVSVSWLEEGGVKGGGRFKRPTINITNSFMRRSLSRRRRSTADSRCWGSRGRF